MKIRYLAVYIFGMLSFYSCEEAFDVDISDKKPTLVSPVNYYSGTDSVPVFYWDSLPSAKTYTIQVVTPRFDSVVKIIKDSTISKNAVSFKLKPGNYEWRIKGNNSNSSSLFSDKWKLTIL